MDTYPPKPIPPKAWDTHYHIFEPDLFLLSQNRHFTPSRAFLTDLQAFEHSLGIEHVCIAHGLPYGADCKSLLYYLERFEGRARGICVLDLETVTDEILDLYHEAGVRSVRLDFFRHAAMHDFDAQARLIDTTAQRLVQWRGKAGNNWNIQIQQPHLEFWPGLCEIIRQCPVPVVVDHMALIAGSSYRYGDATNIQNDTYLRESERRGLETLCQALRDRNLWIKISAPYRCSNLGPRYEDLRWVVRRFVNSNPRRLLWGSDWPHTQRHEDRAGKSRGKEEAFLEIDDRAWIESLSTWLSEEEWRLMWVGNPAVLYDYQASVICL